MEHKTPKQRLTDLIRATFIGFIIAVIVILINPELRDSMVIIYGLMAGKNGVEAFVKGKTETK